MLPKLNPADAISTLCPACGMCCNGVLFADVKVLAGDDLKKLSRLGLRLEQHGSKMRFTQPCPAFDGKLCRIYKERPSRCAAFECRQLKDVQAGKQSVEAALDVIRMMRRQAEKVAALIVQLGNADATASLSHRYEIVMSEPWDLSADRKLLKCRNDLPKAMGELIRIAEESFLT
ncbi:MAG TPA: YkgJ family cysteine cluster protein [Candidatus Saccharimonadales bacterium]|nr:YkgJ family cysteine cluster protein [Candidatus Saccharimonadales bacterium]